MKVGTPMPPAILFLKVILRPEDGRRLGIYLMPILSILLLDCIVLMPRRGFLFPIRLLLKSLSEDVSFLDGSISVEMPVIVSLRSSSLSSCMTMLL